MFRQLPVSVAWVVWQLVRCGVFRQVPLSVGNEVRVV